MPTIYQIALVACFSAFIILILGKTEIRYKFRDLCLQKDLKFCRLLAEMLECDLCISFWISVVISTVLAIFARETGLLLIPMFSTPITRLMI
jgi:hypothetical protein